jgi:hypothetical protein
MVDTANKRKSDILSAVLKLPLLPQKSHEAETAANEIGFAVHLVVTPTENQYQKSQLTSRFKARNQIEEAISSMETLITSLEALGSVAVKAIDRQADHDVIADDIGYVYVRSLRMGVDALRLKARDALEDFEGVKAPRGRPHKSSPVESVAEVAFKWYEELTGERVTRHNDPYGGKTDGPFERFLGDIFSALELGGSQESLTRRIMEKKANKKSN